MYRSPKDELQLVGQVVTHYRILEQLGAGGMGVVYKAEDTRLHRPAVLKFLPRRLTLDEDARRRFVHEAQAASALDHANICTIYEIDEFDAHGTFIAMAYYEGQDLSRQIAQGPLAIDLAIDIAEQLARGLAKAHEQGIVHRDIKPANVLLTADGVAKLVDFGVAKLSGRTQITQAGETVGTAAYMSPEQVRGEEVEHRTDIWALGAMLYEMLTGEQPFQGDYTQAVLYQILHEEPRRIADARSGVPAGVIQIVEKCLRKEPDRRYASMSEVLLALKRVRTGAGSGWMNRAAPLFSGRTRGSRRSAVLVTVAVIAAVAVGFVLGPSGGEWSSWLGISQMPEARHVAVLPFRNVAGDEASAAFASGLMETISSKLTQLEQFSDTPYWVVPASDVLAQSVRSAEEARRVFGANLVVDGSVQKDQDRVRVVLNLIDASSQRTLESDIVDYTGSGGHVVQDEAVIRITSMLRLQLGQKANDVLQAGGTTVPGANEYYLQGRGYLNDFQKQENVESAIDLFERAIQEDSLYALAYAGLGEAYLRKYGAAKEVRYIDEAVRYSERALELDRRLSPVYVTIGMTHSAMGRYDEALDMFQEALEIDPMNPYAFRGRASALRNTGRIEQAEETLKKAIKLRPNYWAGYNELGLFYYRQGRYADAARLLETVTSLAPGNAWGFLNLGSAYFAQGKKNEAIEMFERSLEIEPDYGVYSNLATIYFYEGRYGEAARTYEMALRLNDMDYRVWGYLGEAYYWSDSPEKAREAFEQAIGRAKIQLDVNPNDPHVLVNQASYHARLGRKTASRTLLEQVVDQDPTDLEILFVIGETYEQLGERERALEWIGRAIRGGYSMEEIESAPGLRSLRNDPKYRQISQ